MAKLEIADRLFEDIKTWNTAHPGYRAELLADLNRPVITARCHRVATDEVATMEMDLREVVPDWPTEFIVLEMYTKVRDWLAGLKL